MEKKIKKVKGYAVVGTYKGLNTDDPWNYRNQAMIYKEADSAESVTPAGFVVVPCEITYLIPNDTL